VRERCRDFGIFGRAREQRADRHHENQKQEDRERCDEEKRHRAFLRFRELQFALEPGGGFERRFGGNRHRVHAKVSWLFAAASALRRRPSLPYFDAHAVKRCSSSSP
jgi:hypothetical protein